MKTITLKTHYGNHVVIINNTFNVFSTIREALAFIFKERGLMK